MSDTIPLIAVIGIGRTLSSALCECMKIMGVSFGRQEIRGEHILLARYLEKLHPFPRVATECSQNGRDVRGELAEILRQIVLQCGNCTPGIKYPTLCWHLPELREAWTAGPIRWIHIDRQLRDSIRSLANRSTPQRSVPRLQATADQCRRFQQSLWLAKEAWFRGGVNHLHVWAEDLLDDPAGELRRVAEHVEFDVPAEKLATAVAHIDRAKAPHSR